jgi:4-hydroxy-tetrahydrodipicolinate synthase
MVTPLATPLLDADALDCDGLEKLIEHVIAGGVTGIFVLGTTGESASFSYRLRAEVIRAACSLVRGRVPVLAGISDTSYAETVRLAQTARDAGAEAVVTAPPYYFACSQDDLLRYVELVAGAAQSSLSL